VRFVTVPDHDVPLPVKVTEGVSAPEKVTTGAVERLSLAVTDMVTDADDLNGPVPDDPSRNVTALAVGGVLSTVSAVEVPVCVVASLSRMTTSSLTRTAFESNVTAFVPEIVPLESEMSLPTVRVIGSEEPVISVVAAVSEYWRSVALEIEGDVPPAVPPNVKVLPFFTAVCPTGADSVGAEVAVAKARPGQANSTTAANAMTHTTPIARACTPIHEASPRSRAGEMLAFRGGVLSPWAEATKVVEKHGARPGVPHLREHHHDAMAPL
jgi:hypothetical protein